MSLDLVTGLRCIRCEKDYPITLGALVCLDHDESHIGNLDVVYDYQRIKQQNLFGHPDLVNKGMWAYDVILPIKEGVEKPAIMVGNTPLHKAQRLSKHLGIENLWIKLDGNLPSNSHKDRASSIAVMQAKAMNIPQIVTSSTGNAAASLACIAASEGLQAILFVSASTRESKLAQMKAYGAKIIKVEGGYEDAIVLSEKVAAKLGWYNRNTGINPFMTEGKKTAAFEIAQQLNWKIPQRVYVPVGDGCIIGAQYKGFWELKEIGKTDHMPQIRGAMAEGCPSLKVAFDSPDNRLPKIAPRTTADSLSVAQPRDAFKALRAVRESGGGLETVSDEAMLEAALLLASYEGIFVEPACASTLALLLEDLRNEPRLKEQSLCLLMTGHGLKTAPLYSDILSQTVTCKPDFASFTSAYEQIA